MMKKVDRLQERMAELQAQIEAAKTQARNNARRTVMRAAERAGLVDAVASAESRASDLVPHFRSQAQKLRGDEADTAGAKADEPDAGTETAEPDVGAGETHRGGFFNR